MSEQTTTTTTTPAAASGGEATTAAPVNAQDALAGGYNETMPDDVANTSDEGQSNSDNPDDAQSQDGTDADQSDTDGQSSEGEQPENQKKAKDKDADSADEAEGEDGDDGEAEGEEEKSADTYEDFKLPEGVELDSEAMEKAIPILKKHDVPQEAAQELVDAMVDWQSRQIKAMTDNHNKTVESWRNQTVTEFGKEGEQAYKEKVAVAKRGINQFFDEDGIKMLNSFGVGNHPGLFAMAYQVGLAVSEDGSGNSTPGGGGGEATLAETWYSEK